MWVQDSCRHQSKSPGSVAATGRINVAVAVTEGARAHIHEIAVACEALGLRHAVTLSGIGVLIGSVARCDLRRLWSLPGVLAIEVERKLRTRQLSACAG